MEAFKKYLKSVWLLVLSIVGGILYRMGGAEGWNTKFRDLGVAFVMGVFMVLLRWSGAVHFWFWASLSASVGLTFGALTTYWKKKGTDAQWYHWVFHGLGIAGAMLPYTIYSGEWIPFFIRLVLCPILICLWATFMNRKILWWNADVVNEFGRGVWSIATLYAYCL